MPDINQPQFDPDTQLRLAEVKLSLEVEDFLRSPIGRYILGRAESDVAEAVEALKTVDPEDAKAIRAAQQKAHLADELQRWLQDAIMNGRNAEEQLHQQQDLSGD